VGVVVEIVWRDRAPEQRRYRLIDCYEQSLGRIWREELAVVRYRAPRRRLSPLLPTPVRGENQPA
jgi:hypothetical protein